MAPPSKAGVSAAGQTPFRAHAFGTQLVHSVARGPEHERHVGSQSWQTCCLSRYVAKGQLERQRPECRCEWTPYEMQLVHMSGPGPLHVRHDGSHGVQTPDTSSVMFQGHCSTHSPDGSSTGRSPAQLVQLDLFSGAHVAQPAAHFCWLHSQSECATQPSGVCQPGSHTQLPSKQWPCGPQLGTRSGAHGPAWRTNQAVSK